MMNKLRARVDRLEDDQTSMQSQMAFITYAEDEKSECEAINEWEASNGPISHYQHVFVTSYESRPQDPR